MATSTSSTVRLRQIALVSSDLSKAQEQITHVLGVPIVFEDPAVGQWGLANFLIPLGGDIIEVVAPTRKGTTAGRLLEKRGDGGYMIIMQTIDAARRRAYIEESGKSKVIFSHPFSNSYPSWGGAKDEGWCIQYHPKGIKGGMMPELDSHTISSRNPTPLISRFSPWHACGKDYDHYVEVMKANSQLYLLGCDLQVEQQQDPEQAATQWADLFGIPVAGHKLCFTNAELVFQPAGALTTEGLRRITVGVETQQQLGAIRDRARDNGLVVDPASSTIHMVGVEWHIVVLQQQDSTRTRTSRL
jgi:hypothetical protein